MVSADLEQALRAAWAELAFHTPHARRFRTKRISAALNVDAHAGLRAVDDAPCLLIDAQAPPDALFEVGGMRLAHASSDARLLLVLSLEDLARADLFATVCADALCAALCAQDAEALESFLARLDAWRRFLRERRTGLTQSEIVGLIGELIVLRRVLEVNSGLLASWCSPEHALHDFVRAGHALEVKATLGSASSLRISNLDQLDASGLRRLDLLFLRMVEATDGESLEEMMASISSLLPSELARRMFENALLRRGLMPDDVAARSSPRVITQHLGAFSVTPTFPRLARNSVPPAVSEAEYLLELRALDRHAADVDAVILTFAGGT